MTRRTYNMKQDEKIILRDHLSLERTKLANERTFLAYIRTVIYLIVGGIAFLQIENLQNVQWIGIFLFALSLTTLAVGSYKYYRLRKSLNRYYKD